MKRFFVVDINFVLETTSELTAEELRRSIAHSVDCMYPNATPADAHVAELGIQTAGAKRQAEKVEG